jgi:hypothetical protein
MIYYLASSFGIVKKNNVETKIPRFSILKRIKNKVKRIYLYLKVKNNSFQISLHSAAKKKQQKTFASIVNSTTIKAYQLCS